MQAVAAPQHDKIRTVMDWLDSRVIGQRPLIERLMTALLCGGHLLVEGAPGLAKTRAIKELKKDVDRVQYFEIVNPGTLAPVRKHQKQMAVLTACFVGKTRLIDNVIIRA